MYIILLTNLINLLYFILFYFLIQFLFIQCNIYLIIKSYDFILLFI